MPSEDFTSLTADLRALGGGRVWSLMVSLFGDLAQGEGDLIEGPVLSAIMAALGVKPEAARVALHRLRNDGWIASEKQGRISRHGLTNEGRSKSRDASPRIYSNPKLGALDWQLVILNPADTAAPETLTQRGFILLQPNVYVGATTLTPPADAAVFQGGDAPAWLADAVIPPKLQTGYELLAETLTSLAQNLPEPSEMSPLDTAVLRCLVVHNWRRLVLKHTAPPLGLVAPDAAYHQCLTLVDDLLTRYARPALHDIAQD